MSQRRRALTLLLLLAGAVIAVAAQEPARHQLTIKAKNHQFTPARFEVAQGDIVKVTLVAEDATYSFVIDEYRIAKRMTPGKPDTFEFRADRAGPFAYYCGLTTDAACKDMKGQMIVVAKQ